MKNSSLCLSLVAAAFHLVTSNAYAHKLRFVAFDLPVPTGTSQLIPAVDPKKTSTIDIGTSRFSKPIDVAPGVYKIVLPDGVTTGHLNLEGDGIQKLLVIVFPGANCAVNILTAPDGASSFGAGDRLIINATKSEIRVQIGDRNITCKTGTTQVVKPPGNAKEGRLPVRMGYSNGSEWQIFNSTWWPDDRTCRSIVLLYAKGDTGVPSVKTIEETPPEPKTGT